MPHDKEYADKSVFIDWLELTENQIKRTLPLIKEGQDKNKVVKKPFFEELIKSCEEPDLEYDELLYSKTSGRWDTIVTSDGSHLSNQSEGNQIVPILTGIVDIDCRKIIENMSEEKEITSCFFSKTQEKANIALFSGNFGNHFELMEYKRNILKVCFQNEHEIFEKKYSLNEIIIHMSKYWDENIYAVCISCRKNIILTSRSKKEFQEKGKTECPLGHEILPVDFSTSWKEYKKDKCDKPGEFPLVFSIMNFIERITTLFYVESQIEKWVSEQRNVLVCFDGPMQCYLGLEEQNTKIISKWYASICDKFYENQSVNMKRHKSIITLIAVEKSGEINRLAKSINFVFNDKKQKIYSTTKLTMDLFDLNEQGFMMNKSPARYFISNGPSGYFSFSMMPYNSDNDFFGCISGNHELLENEINYRGISLVNYFFEHWTGRYENSTVASVKAHAATALPANSSKIINRTLDKKNHF